jgi:hypothetical protein
MPWLEAEFETVAKEPPLGRYSNNVAGPNAILPWASSLATIALVLLVGGSVLLSEPVAFAHVVVRQSKGTTLHHVTLSRELYERLIAGMHTPERLIEAAFRFLLDREPKESILRRFDVSVIARYFPEFERELPRILCA